MKLIELIARAICIEGEDDPDRVMDYGPEFGGLDKDGTKVWTMYVDQAKAALDILIEMKWSKNMIITSNMAQTEVDIEANAKTLLRIMRDEW